MENVYNVLYKKPALQKWQMPYELEEIAQQLVLGGRFRIDANEKCNFVRFALPEHGLNLVFSYRELCDENLIPRTTGIIQSCLSYKYRGDALKAKTQSELERLRYDVTKIVGVDAKTEMMLARAIVQAIDPCVMMLLLFDGTELFISYSHTVGDMLDVQSWQSVGSSSGLQSTGFHESSVFVSCGGHPFLPEDKKQFSDDGFNALARMIVIGGQELGHYSDIIRDKRGRPVSRHSADLGGRRAKEKVRLARLNDIIHADAIKEIVQKTGAPQAAEFERHMKFFKKQKRRGLVVANTYRKMNNATRKMLRRCRRYGVEFLATIAPDDHKHYATPIVMMIDDMRFNLAPKADAYSREDPVEEEAIACIEALARIPQQVNKWGHLVTKEMMPNLYEIYYREVIPACIATYEHLTGKKYSFTLTKKRVLRRWWERFFVKI